MDIYGVDFLHGDSYPDNCEPQSIGLVTRATISSAQA